MVLPSIFRSLYSHSPVILGLVRTSVPAVLRKSNKSSAFMVCSCVVSQDIFHQVLNSWCSRCRSVESFSFNASASSSSSTSLPAPSRLWRVVSYLGGGRSHRFYFRRNKICRIVVLFEQWNDSLKLVLLYRQPWWPTSTLPSVLNCACQL